MMNTGNLRRDTRHTNDRRQRMIALASALMLLISSCGLTAFAESDEYIYSAPVTAPAPEAQTTPETEAGGEESTPAPAGMPEEETVPQAESGGETEAEEEPEVTEEPEDLTVYETGTLTAEADGIGITVDYSAEARVPAGSTLTLTRAAGGDLYNAMKSAARVLKSEENETWKREVGDEAVFYVIALKNQEGEEVHPEAGVTLTCTNLTVPENAAGFVTGDRAENIDGGDNLTVGFLPEAIGYAYLKQVQTGTITLTHEDRDYMVTASYGPDAGFPAGTELKVREIRPGTPEYALYSGMTDEALNEDWAEITLERYFDIAFVSGGTELEPLADVDVQIIFRDKIEQNEDTEVQAVHIENNEATVIESDTESNKAAKHDDEAIDTVTFTSDSFSVYGVVQKKKITRKILAADGQTYEIEVSYGPEAEIPENAEVKVEEIPEGSGLWEAYRKQTAAALGADDVRLPGLYDISIIDEEGAKVVPQAPVSVAVRLANAESTGEELHVVHFTEEIPQELVEAEAKSEEETEVQPLTVQDLIASETITEKTVEGDTVTFDTQGFSVYAFAYTVDFYYGEYEYHLEGGGTLALSELFALLNIDRVAADADQVTFSDPTLLQVEQAEDDWLLISLQAFDTEEKLTIHFKNGDTIVLKVTDARKPKLTDTYGRIKIVKEWYDAEGNRIEAPTLDDTYVSDFIVTAYEYNPSDIVRLHFIDSNGNENENSTVIVPTGSLRLTLYNTSGTPVKGYLFSQKPTSVNPITNPYDSVNLLTDIAIQAESATLNDGSRINYWVMDIDINDYAGELNDVYLGIANSDSGIAYFAPNTYPNRTAGISSSTKAMNIAYLDDRWEGQTYRNRHIWDMIKGTNNEYTLQNQDLELTSAGGKFFGYSIVENKASYGTAAATNFTTSISINNGIDTIYSNGLTGWTPNYYITTPDPTATVIVRNQLRANVDIPVEKSWPFMEANDSHYDWEATFVLQWAPLYEGEGTPSTPFTDVEPKQYMTITEAMMGSENPAIVDSRTFRNLPMYGSDENGDFRYEYSVEEISYKVFSHSTKEIIASYDYFAEGDDRYTGNLPKFIPYYPHDAGELSEDASDYKIMVVNGEVFSGESPKIGITVNKAWEDPDIMNNSDSFARLNVQRYDQQTTRTVYNYDPTKLIEVRFVDNNNSVIKSEFVQKGVVQSLHLTLAFRNYGSYNIRITRDGGTEVFRLESPSSNNLQQEYDFYTFTPEEGPVIFKIISNSWRNGPWGAPQEGFNPKSGLEMADTGSTSEPVPDSVYNNEDHSVILNASNNWTNIVTGLPVTEYSINGNTQTIHHYSYYFVEEAANPGGYTSSFIRYDTVGTENEIKIGGIDYRINYDGEHVTVKNLRNTLRVRKEWRSIARSDWKLYPEASFTLYGSNTKNDNDWHLIKSGIKLNETNNYEWTPETDPDVTFTLPHYNYYCVQENTNEIVENQTLQTPAWDNQKYEVWMYYKDDGTGEKHYSEAGKLSKNAATDQYGTITIVNSLKASDYFQMDLKKKWMEWGTPTSWDTTTGVYKRLHDLVMGFVIYRRVWSEPLDGDLSVNNANLQHPSDKIISPGPMGWSDYGHEILAGYDSNGNRVLDDGGNTFELYPGDGGNWHWTIKPKDDHTDINSDQSGMPAEGWYTKPDGEVVWAYFEYTVRETGIWKNLKKDPVDDPEISWFSNSVPRVAWCGKGQHYIREFARDIEQDQDRLMNGEGFHMSVEKNWIGDNWDAREVYIKIYRQLQDGSRFDDFTEELVRDINTGNLVGYLNSDARNMIDLTNKWIVFTPGKTRLDIDKVLRTDPRYGSGTNLYNYWLVEVGYKDKQGNVHLYEGNGKNQSDINTPALEKLTPVYSSGDNGSSWGQNNRNTGIVIGTRGSVNLMSVTNTPVRDFAVFKKWLDADGDEIEAPVDEIKIRIRQTRTATVGGSQVTYENYVKFGPGQDDNKLTIRKNIDRNRVTLVAKNYPSNNAQQEYRKTEQTDQNIGKWTLYISGLEECYLDNAGVLWTCTYQIEEFIEPRAANLLQNYVTEISYDGIIDRDNRNITITNTRMDGGMLKVIKQIADGSDNETEDPFEITVTLTPQGSHQAFNGAMTLEKIKKHIEIDEEDTILISGPVIGYDETSHVLTITMTLAGRGSFTVRDIAAGTTYEVTEDVTNAHGWRQLGGTVYSNGQKKIRKQQLDTATITNYQRGALGVLKKVTVNGKEPDPANEKTVNGDFTFTVAGPAAADEADRITKYVRITISDGAAVSYRISDTEAGLNDAESIQLMRLEHVIVDDLPEGDYVITELADAGSTLTAITGGTGDGNPAARTVTVHVSDGDIRAETAGSRAEYTNNIELGKLIVEKEVRKDGVRNNEASGTFMVAVYEVSGTGEDETEEPVGEIQSIAVTDGTSTQAVFDNLYAGRKYRVYEVSVDDTTNPATVTKLNPGDKLGVYTVSYETEQTVTIPGGQDENTSSVTVINDEAAEVTVKVKKNWPAGQTVPSGTLITFSITATVPGETEGKTEPAAGVTITPSEVHLDGIKDTGDDAVETTAWEYEWKKLPKLDDNNKEITYTVTETAYTINQADAGVTIPAGVRTEEGNVITFTFENKMPVTERHAVKVWDDNNNSNNSRPAGIEFTLTAKVNNSLLTPAQLTAEGIVREEQVVDGNTVMPAQTAAQTIRPNQNGDWPAADWTYLPVYTRNGVKIEYDIEETPVGNGYTLVSAVWGTGAEALTKTFTNRLNRIDIDIIKVDDSDVPVPLSGAEFKLEKYKGTDGSGNDEYEEVAAYSTNIIVGSEGSEKGKAHLRNLSDGTYRLREMKAPDGYTLLSMPLIFTVEGGAVTVPGDDNTTYIYTQKTDSTPDTYTIRNTPAARLPATGGTGTLIYTVTGALLILLAGVLLAVRKRKNEQ